MLLSILLSLTLLEACSQEEIPAEVVALECRGGDLPTLELPEGPSWTWLDITIGESTEQNVIDRFGEPELTRLRPEEEPQACMYIYDDGNGGYIDVWLAGDLVIGLEFRQPYPLRDLPIEAPKTLEQARDLYGRADIVGFSALGYGFRSVVWLDHGIQAAVSLITDDHQIGPILYFTPMTETEFDNSLWASLVLDENPTLYPSSDLRDTAPKDPFDW